MRMLLDRPAVDSRAEFVRRADEIIAHIARTPPQDDIFHSTPRSREDNDEIDQLEEALRRFLDGRDQLLVIRHPGGAEIMARHPQVDPVAFRDLQQSAINRIRDLRNLPPARDAEQSFQEREWVEAVRRHLDERERRIKSLGLERYIEILCEEMDIFPLRE